MQIVEDNNRSNTDAAASCPNNLVELTTTTVATSSLASDSSNGDVNEGGPAAIVFGMEEPNDEGTKAATGDTEISHTPPTSIVNNSIIDKKTKFEYNNNNNNDDDDNNDNNVNKEYFYDEETLQEYTPQGGRVARGYTSVIPCWIFCLIPRCCKWDNFDAPREATGLSLDYYARGHVLMSSMVLGPALLELAQAAAQLNCPSATATTASHFLSAAMVDNTTLMGGDDDMGKFWGDNDMVNTFTSPTLSNTSGTIVNHDDNDDDATVDLVFDDSCRIYGFRPTSLITNIAIAAGILGSLSLPFVGAVVDHTPYRRQVAAISALAMATLKGVEAMIGPSTWLWVALLQVVTSLLYNVHTAAAYAYQTELTHHPNEKAQYNSWYNVIMYFSMLLFLIQVFVSSSLLGLNDNDVATARLSQILTFVISISSFGVAWYYFFDNRPALRQMPEGSTLWTVGFVKVWHTSRHIVMHYRALKWTILARMFSEAAVSGFAAIVTTYLKTVLDMSANEIGFVFLISLLTGIPGSYIGGVWAVRSNAVQSAVVCNILCIVITATASAVLTGPQHKGWPSTFFFALWGMALGWLPPVDTTIFMSLMPSSSRKNSTSTTARSDHRTEDAMEHGAEGDTDSEDGGEERDKHGDDVGDSRAELMGLMMLATSALSWLPPLVFSFLNELGANMAWSMGSLNLFFAVAIVCLAQIGDYNQALAEATGNPCKGGTFTVNGDGPEEQGSTDDEDDEENDGEEGNFANTVTSTKKRRTRIATSDEHRNRTKRVTTRTAATTTRTNRFQLLPQQSLTTEE